MVWIDREIAKIFFLSEKKTARISLKGSHVDHHSHRRDSLDSRRQENKLFHDLLSELKNVQEILILGPGVAKHHFRNFLNEQYPATGRLVLGCEASDHPSDEEILDYAKKYFEEFKIPSASNG